MENGYSKHFIRRLCNRHHNPLDNQPEPTAVVVLPYIQVELFTGFLARTVINPTLNRLSGHWIAGSKNTNDWSSLVTRPPVLWLSVAGHYTIV